MTPPARLATFFLIIAGLVLTRSPGLAQEGAIQALKVGIIPISDFAPIYLGIKKGFFKDEQLSIDLTPAPSGAAIIPAVISGDDQIGFTNVVSLLQAASHGLPVQAVIAASQAADQANTTAALMVAKDGPIHSLRDLEGKTIAVNALNSIAGVTMKAVLEKRGVDISKLKFVELGFPEMPVALRQGRVDAIGENEPFVSVAKADGDRVLFDMFREFDPKLTVAVLFTTRQYAAQHAAVLERFRRAMAKSLRYASAHQLETREILLTFTKLDRNAAQSMGLSSWGPTIDMGSIARLQASMVRYGLLPHALELQQVFPPSAVSGH